MSVRLRHTQFKDVNFVVVDVARPYTEPYDCPACRITHEFKAYHLRLDSHGEVTVSDDIYDRLAEIPGLPLAKVGRDRNPRPQVLLMPGGEAQEVPAHLEEAARWARHERTLPSVVPPEEG